MGGTTVPGPSHDLGQQHRRRPGKLEPRRDVAGHPDPPRPAASTHPNPTATLNYRQRRELGHDVDLLDQALAHTADTHPSPLPPEQLRRVFWEAFTGGDIAYAPEPLAISAGSGEYPAYRSDAGDSLDRDLPRLQTAHHQVTWLTGEDLGPLIRAPQSPHTMPADTDGVKILLDPHVRPAWTGYSPF
jgi:hypothetical protein